MGIGIFGTGSALKDFLSVLPDHIKVAGLGDNNVARHGELIEGHQVHSAQGIVAMDLDCYVIAARAVDAIRAQLLGLGAAPDRIFAYYPSYSQDLAAAVNHDIAAMNRLLGINLPAAGIASMYLWPEADDAQRSGPSEDFVRRHAFRLCAEQIAANAVPGAIAELGVYQGEQAALLNQLFPDRALHLFDTFEGFADQDLNKEKKANFSGAALGDFQDTSVELVMGRMRSPDQVIVHKGFFPDTAHDVEGRFAFVSLDVDLYEPTLAGLEWFYPRLERGGYIFIHDYNNKRYLGVRNAVEAFRARHQVCAFPLPDFAGSLVILK